jgi:hypothetical protein
MEENKSELKLVSFGITELINHFEELKFRVSVYRALTDDELLLFNNMVDIIILQLKFFEEVR